MTTPAERTEAVKMAAQLAMQSGAMDINNYQRRCFQYMLRHLPTIAELEQTAEACPELWGKP